MDQFHLLLYSVRIYVATEIWEPPDVLFKLAKLQLYLSKFVNS